MQTFRQMDDAMGKPTAVIPSSDHILAVKLLAAVPRLIPVPDDARIVLFSAEIPFWLRMDGAATLPTGDILDGSASELNPAARNIADVSSIGLIASSDTILSLAFYR